MLKCFEKILRLAKRANQLGQGLLLTVRDGEIEREQSAGRNGQTQMPVIRRDELGPAGFGRERHGKAAVKFSHRDTVVG